MLSQVECLTEATQPRTELYSFVFFDKNISCTNGVNCHIREAVAVYSRPRVLFSTEMDAGSISNDDSIRVCGKWRRIHEVRRILVEGGDQFCSYFRQCIGFTLVFQWIFIYFHDLY